MAFDFRWFVRNIIHTHSTGEDKELEELLLRQGIHIEYIDTLETLDEKVRQPDALRNQRRRWIATQLFLALKMGRNLPTALLNGNGDYLLKTLQAFIAPRSILLALIGFFSCVLCIFSPASSIKWWILLILLNGALYLAIPSNMRYKIHEQNPQADTLFCNHYASQLVSLERNGTEVQPYTAWIEL